MDHNYANDWYNSLIEDTDGMPRMTPDRVFLYKGKPSNMGNIPMTSSYEIQQWVISMMPPQGQLAFACPFAQN